MRSKTLTIVLLVVTALTKPKAWVLSAVAFIAAWAFSYIGQGQAIYIEHWRPILEGMINPEVPFAQKSFLIGFLCLLIAMSMISINIVKAMAIELNNRFGKKLHILADHEHPFWPMVNTNSGAS